MAHNLDVPIKERRYNEILYTPFSTVNPKNILTTQKIKAHPDTYILLPKYGKLLIGDRNYIFNGQNPDFRLVIEAEEQNADSGLVRVVRKNNDYFGKDEFIGAPAISISEIILLNQDDLFRLIIVKDYYLKEKEIAGNTPKEQLMKHWNFISEILTDSCTYPAKYKEGYKFPPGTSELVSFAKENPKGFAAISLITSTAHESIIDPCPFLPKGTIEELLDKQLPSDFDEKVSSGLITTIAPYDLQAKKKIKRHSLFQVCQHYPKLFYKQLFKK